MDPQSQPVVPAAAAVEGTLAELWGPHPDAVQAAMLTATADAVRRVLSADLDPAEHEPDFLHAPAEDR